MGLIGIGREWGYVKTGVPDQESVQKFLRCAFESGIRFYDTAPSYAYSEERLGIFLASISAHERSQITVSTKFGENWDNAVNKPIVDHSYDFLVRSLDKSLKLLGKIDILQIHKTTPDVLRSADMAKALEYALRCGIRILGASVSDEESGRIVCEDHRFGIIQLPYNMDNTKFGGIIDLAVENDKMIIVNRPFNMGQMIAGDGKRVSSEDAFRFVLQKKFKGVVLTGTKSPEHLRENIKAFSAAITS